jgi:transcriptional regulator of aromatic amino acid metabolism
MAAPINAPVLILGESGTGKEMLAKAIHRRSAQNGGPFVASTGALMGLPCERSRTTKGPDGPFLNSRLEENG